MRKLAILLLVASPLLMLIGMAGCVASIASIGNGSRQMTPFESFGLLGSPLFFISGIVLISVDWYRRKRNRATIGAQHETHGSSTRESGGFAGAAVSTSRIMVSAVLATIGFGVLGLAVNLVFLIWAARGLKNTFESDSIARYLAVPLVVLLICMPVGYAILAWRESFRKRLGQALQPYEDSMMKAVEGIVGDYVRSRTEGASHAATLTACTRRVSNLPEPVSAILARFIRRAKLSSVLDIAMENASRDRGDWGTLASSAVATMRGKLDEMLFRPRTGWLIYAFAFNLALFGLLAMVLRDPPIGRLPGFPRFMGTLMGFALLVTTIGLSKHPAAKGIRDLVMAFGNCVKVVITAVLMTTTGIFLVSRKRSPRRRWAGYCLIEVVYGLLTLLAGVILRDKFEGEQTLIIVPVACAVFLVPSFFLMRWIRRTGTALPPERTPVNPRSQDSPEL